MKRAVLARALTAIALASIAASCVRVAWRRETRFTPPDPVEVASLRPGESTLAECLARLGAPLEVWEYKGDGTALAYASLHERRLGLNVSVPVARYASASFDYDDSRAGLDGVLLLFDARGSLESVERGSLRDLERARARRRPSAPGEPAPRAE